MDKLICDCFSGQGEALHSGACQTGFCMKQSCGEERNTYKQTNFSGCFTDKLESAGQMRCVCDKVCRSRDFHTVGDATATGETEDKKRRYNDWCHDWHNDKIVLPGLCGH